MAAVLDASASYWFVPEDAFFAAVAAKLQPADVSDQVGCAVWCVVCGGLCCGVWCGVLWCGCCAVLCWVGVVGCGWMLWCAVVLWCGVLWCLLWCGWMLCLAFCLCVGPRLC